MTGNHLKFSRPSLHFAPAFDEEPHRRVIKEMLTQVFLDPVSTLQGETVLRSSTLFFLGRRPRVV